MAAAAAAVLVLFNSTAFSTNMIAFTFEIIRMTGGTIGRILWIGIRNRSGHSITMTGTTPRFPSVVAGVVPLRIMGEDVRCPAIG